MEATAVLGTRTQPNRQIKYRRFGISCLFIQRGEHWAKEHKAGGSSSDLNMSYLHSNRIICLTKDLFLFYVLKIKRSLFTFIRLEKTVTEMATGCFRMVKMDILDN